MSRLAESDIEQVALDLLAGLGYDVRYGPDVELGQPAAERTDPHFRDVVLSIRLRDALARLNPDVPADALDYAQRKLTEAGEPGLLKQNRLIHQMLVEGIMAEHRNAAGEVVWSQARVLDFDHPDNNDWLAVNQFTVKEGQYHRRPDVVLFVNGLPLAVIELKNPADENATIWHALQQLKTYQRELPTLFSYNAALVISDGLKARVGAIAADREWFKPWRTIGGQDEAGPGLAELPVLLEGVFEKQRFLDLIRHFTLFERHAGAIKAKKIAGYHQFHAVNVAVEQTLRASQAQAASAAAGGDTAGSASSSGNRRIGVVWHTQGSGKSLTMAFYAGRLIVHPQMENPTIVVLTDRNDLDDQLFGTFAACEDLLRQPPVQAQSRDDLKAKLNVAAGGVIFTTIQKFFPDEKGERASALTHRRNVVVIADEAHRSQYDFIDGFARHMRDALPNASFIGFTGTPIEKDDKNTRNVFGDYISVYDIERAVADNATVPIYYESRIAKLQLKDTERPRIDPDFEEATEGEEIERKEKLKSKWAQLEALVGADERIRRIAADILQHFDARLGAMRGKAMIVCMSRRICVDLYNALVSLRPALHDAAGPESHPLDRGEIAGTGLRNSVGRPAAGVQRSGRGEAQAMLGRRETGLGAYRDVRDDGRPTEDDAVRRASPRPAPTEDDMSGSLKVVMTGNATDPADWQQHIRNKPRREDLARRFRDPEDPFQIVIVRDMWLTGFDAPSLHTMYLDKPMRGHGLMQAIARVNRVFRDKPGGLVVDYLGLADELRQALITYTESGGQGSPKLDQEEAVAKMLEAYEVVRTLFHGFDWALWSSGPAAAKSQLLAAALEHIYAQRDGKTRLKENVARLSRLFALAVPHPDAIRIRDDVGFFQAVRAAMVKDTPDDQRTDHELDHAIRQIVSGAISSDTPIDIFAAAGLKRPEISILSDDFLAEVRGMPQRNLAVELLRRLLHDEIRQRSTRSLVQSRSFAEMLEKAVRLYQNRAIETVEVIERLIKLAQDIRAAAARGDELHLTEDELAFYDALETNDSAVKVLGEPLLCQIARDLAAAIRGNVSIDWNLRECSRAAIRVLVKRILRKHGYPPDKQDQATRTVLEQAELLSATWADA
jgi:type I restriction enzyme R subunit